MEEGFGDAYILCATLISDSLSTVQDCSLDQVGRRGPIAIIGGLTANIGFLTSLVEGTF